MVTTLNLIQVVREEDLNLGLPDFKPGTLIHSIKNQMGPLQLDSHVVRKHLVGEQVTHWDMTNKENYHFRWCKLFVCLVPVRFLLTSNMFLYM